MQRNYVPLVCSSLNQTCSGLNDNDKTGISTKRPLARTEESAPSPKKQKLTHLSAASPLRYSLQREEPLSMNMQSLPLELLVAITQFISPQSTLSLLSSCKTFFKARIHQCIDFQYLNLDKLGDWQDFVQYCSSLSENPKPLLRECSDFLHVKGLDLKIDNNVREQDMEALIARLPNLTFIHIDIAEDTTEDTLNSVLKVLNSLPVLSTLELEGSGNKAIHALPSILGECKSLQKLHLYNLPGVTTLPSTIKGLQKLRHLILDNLSGLKLLPAEIGQLVRLQNLALINLPSLECLSPDIGKLVGLQYLYIEKLSIRNLPAEIGMLKNLQRLEISVLRDLHALPEEIGHLGQLQILKLNHLYLSTLPIKIKNLTKLQELYLSYLPFLKRLPLAIGELEQLQKLVLISIGATLLPQIGKLRQLRELILQNLFIHNLPTDMGQLEQLQTLFLNGLHLRSLPDGLEKLVQLQNLIIKNCSKLTSLPAEMLRLPKRNHLVLPAHLCQSKEVG